MTLTPAQIRIFRRAVYSHFNKHGRTLPWRTNINPYRVYISEIMLQQTQVDRVVQKYPGFITAFPDFAAIAAAPLAAVLGAWQGLGYNRRALLLKRAADRIVGEFKGAVPKSPEVLKSLPGIGSATAASIAAFAFNRPTVFIETNIRSVFIHHFFRNSRTVSDTGIMPLVAQTLDAKQPAHWYSALMDYGSALKKEVTNPSRKSSRHVRQPRFEGSKRQARGRILKELLAGPLTLSALARKSDRALPDLKAIMAELVTEGFAEKKNNHFIIKGHRQ